MSQEVAKMPPRWFQDDPKRGMFSHCALFLQWQATFWNVGKTCIFLPCYYFTNDITLFSYNSGNKQNDLLATGFQCDIKYAKSAMTPVAPSGSGTFPRAYTSSYQHLGDAAPDTDQILMKGTGVQMKDKVPAQRSLIVWECGCNLKVPFGFFTWIY